MAGRVLVEQVVAMPIVNPETGAASRTFEYAGKIDLSEDGVLVDYKGCADTYRYIRSVRSACRVSATCSP